MTAGPVRFLHIRAVHSFDNLLYFSPTEFAAADLLKNEIDGGSKEGTAGFKRRFLEVSRAGSRMVMGDHQTALIRDEQTKAALRTQADIKMLQIISAMEATADDSQRGGVKLKPILRSLSSMNMPGNIDDNIDFQLSKSRNIQNQSLSLAMLPQRTAGNKAHSKRRLKGEAELSALVTKAITRRELELGRLSLEAADLNRTYMEMEESSDGDANKAIIKLGLENLFSQMAVVRSASIEVAEALGAWSRFVMLERKAHADRMASEQALGMSSDPREGRAYCVAIAVRGAPLYPKSKPLVSSNSRACRGEEPEKLALDIKYAGIFQRKVDAIEAYRQACIEVPIENRVMPYVDAPPMYIGLRVCGKHYLVRSDFVPPKLPCEQCTAKANAQPKMLVPSMASTLGVDAGLPNGKDIAAGQNQVTLPQFIWHGVNYIDKMWNDLDFIGDVDALRRYQCGIDPSMNPLLLPKEEIKEFYGMLNQIHATNTKTGSGKDLKIMQRLKGKMEQLEDAVAASSWNRDDRTGFEHMGVAYRAPSTVPNLDRMQDYIPAPGKELRLASTADSSHIKISTPSMSNVQILEDISTLPGPLAPVVQSSQPEDTVRKTVRFSSEVRAQSLLEDDDNDIFVGAKPSSPFGKSIPQSASEEKRSALAATAEAAALGKSLSQKYLTLDSNMTGFGSTTLSFTGDNFLTVNSATAGVRIGPEKGSVLRALSILSQSEVADPFLFEDDVMTHITSIQKRSMPAPKGTFTTSSVEKLYSKTAPAGAMGADRTRRKADQPSVEEYPEQYEVKASYEYHGARFETVQTRNALANRTRSTWCRSDVGEWAGLSTKGPNMKSWEHRDQALTNARLAAEKRKDMQQMIRAAISFDYVSCDVSWINELISRAQGMKGSVLGLDILQAELFLKNRLRAITACTKLQRWRRGVVGRRIVRELRAVIKRAVFHRFVTETEAAKLAKVYIPRMLQSVVESLTKRHSRSLVCFTINLRGISVIANVHAMSRNSKKSRRLCPSCLLAAGSATEKFDAGLHQKVRDRVPCTCRYYTEPEKWLIKIYEPLSCYSFQRVFTIAEIRSLLRSAHAVEKIKSHEHLARIVTQSGISSLDDIKTQLELGPLYRLLLRPPAYSSFSVGSQMRAARLDAAVAWLRAQKEGVAMALQMPGMSARLVREVEKPEESHNLSDFFIYNNRYETVLQTRSPSDAHEGMGPLINRSVNKHSKTISVVGSLANAQHYSLSSSLSQKCHFRTQLITPPPSNVYDYDLSNVSEMRKYDDNCDPSTAAGLFKKLGFSGLAGRLVIVNDTDSDMPPPLNKPVSTWEPLQDILFARYHLRRLGWSRPGLEKDCATAKEAWDIARDTAHDHRYVTLERHLMELEDTRSKVLMCDLKIHNAEDRVAAVMAFSKRKLVKFEAEQANEAEDWREAWESAEDGTAWIGLNEARKNRKELKKVLLELEECAAVVSAARKNQEGLYDDQKAKRSWLDFMLGCLADLEAEECDLKRTSAVLEDLARETLTIAMSRMSMSRSCGVPSMGYRISVPTLDLSYIRDPLLRNHRSMRSAWNLVRRQVRRLTPWDRANEHFPGVAIQVCGPDRFLPGKQDPNYFVYARRFSEGTAVRFRAISVSKDPVTGSTIVDTGMEVRKNNECDAPEGALSVHLYPEENAYESDGYILENKFRSQVESCFPTDIVMSEDEVQALCRRYGRGKQKLAGSVALRIADSKYDFTRESTSRQDKKMGVVVYPCVRHHILALPPTYHSRRLKLERQEESDASRILSMMRLNPHSGRICVGLLHLIRRGESVRKVLMSSLWYKDWLASECPSTWANEQAHYLHMFNGRFCLVSVRDTFGSAEVRLSFYGMDPITVTITVPLEDIVVSMLEKPFLLATFICDLIVNRYSADIIDHIVSCLDLEFPGECDKKLRRADLFGETPRLMFCANKFERYRPVFRTHRLLCGAYFCVQVLVSAADDLMVLLQPPIDGQFWCHAYDGQRIPVEITIAELRSVVLKHLRDTRRGNDGLSETIAAAVRPDLYKHMSILHPSHMDALVDFMLSRLVIDKSIIKASTRRMGGVSDEPGEIIGACNSLAATDSDDSSDECDDNGSEARSEFIGGSSVLSASQAPDNKSSYMASLGSSILRYKDSVVDQDDHETRRASSSTMKREKVVDAAGYISWASEEEDNETEDESVFEENFQRVKKVPMRVPGGRRITQKIIKNVIATAKLYNRWAEKRRALLPELDLKSHADVFRRYFAEYSVLNDTGSKDHISHTPLPWKLIDSSSADKGHASKELDAVGGTGDRILVHEELWTTLDPIRFAPPLLPANFDQVDTGAGSTRGPITDYIPAGAGNSAYWNLRVSTSGDKKMLHLKASPAELGAGRAQEAIAKRETSLMGEEEQHRRRADQTVAALRDEQSRAAVLLSVNKRIAPLAEALARERENAEFLISLLHDGLQDLVPSIDYYFVKRALTTYKLGIDRLTIDGDGNAFVSYERKHLARSQSKSIFSLSSCAFDVGETRQWHTSELRDQFPLKVLQRIPSKILSLMYWLRCLIKSLRHINIESILYDAAFDNDSNASSGIHVVHQQAVRKAMARPGTTHHRNTPMLLKALMERLQSCLYPSVAMKEPVSSLTCHGSGYCHVHRRQRLVDPYHNPKAWKQIDKQRYEWELGAIAQQDTDFIARALKGIRPKKIMNAMKRIVFISEPSIDQLGSCSFFMYEPETMRSSIALIEAPPVFPLDIGDVSTESNRFNCGESMRVHLARRAARHVVWRSIVSGIATAAVASCCVEIRTGIAQKESALGSKFLETKEAVEKDMLQRELNSTADDGSKTDAEKVRIRSAYMKGEHREKGLNKRIRVVGVFMPFDEDANPVSFEVDAEEWMPTVRRFLFPGLAEKDHASAGVDRVASRPAMVYIHQGFQGAIGATAAMEINARFNMRLSRWLFERTLKMTDQGTGRDVHIDIPELYGDAVIMLREKPYEETVSSLAQWSERRMLELNALREKRLKMATTRLYKRFANFMNYRDLVFYWAARFEPAFKHVFGIVGTLKNDNLTSANAYPELDSEFVTIDYFRCLLANVMHHVKKIPLGMSDVCFDTLDQAFLVDTDIASGDRARGYSFGYVPVGATSQGHKYAITRQEIEETNIKITTDKYRKFESFNHRRYMSGEQFLCFDTDPLTSAYELQPRATQILYCMLRKHCLECRTPPSYCNVPGCAGVKTAIWESYAAKEVDLDCASEGSLATDSSLSAIGTGIKSLRDTSPSVGSGYHVADIAVREFMLHGLSVALINKVFAAPRPKEVGPTALDWGYGGDGKADSDAVASKKVAVSSPSRATQGSHRAWRGESTHFIMRKSGHQFRSMYRYLFSPQLSQILSQDDYICMRRSALHTFFDETDDSVIKRLCHRAHVLQNEQIRRDNMEKAVVADTSRDIDLMLPCFVVEVLYSAFCAQGVRGVWDKRSQTDNLPLPHYTPSGNEAVFDPYPSEYTRMAGNTYMQRRQGVGGGLSDDTKIIDLGMIAKHAYLNGLVETSDQAEVADEQPMSRKAFEWLCSRLVITRRGPVFGHKAETVYRQGQAVLCHPGDIQNSLVDTSLSTGVNKSSDLLMIDAAPATLKFDRLFSQKSFFMKASDPAVLNERRLKSLVEDEDEEVLAKMKKTANSLRGPFVRIQILYGVLNGYPSFNIPEAGCPPAATRFCHTTMLSDLEYGLTVLVYDYASEVSRALLIQGGLLLRVADALGGRHTDLADLAIRLQARAHQMLVLSRVGTTCTGIDLDPSALSSNGKLSFNDIQSVLKANMKHSESSVMNKVAPFSCRIRAGGSKQFAVDNRQSKVSAAFSILNMI